METSKTVNKKCVEKLQCLSELPMHGIYYFCQQKIASEVKNVSDFHLSIMIAFNRRRYCGFCSIFKRLDPNVVEKVILITLLLEKRLGVAADFFKPSVNRSVLVVKPCSLQSLQWRQ